MAKSDPRGDFGSVGDNTLLSNEFIVQDRKSNNDAAVIISQDRKDALPMWNCVAVLLKAKIVNQKRKRNPNSNRQTVCIGLAGGSQEKCDEESILMNDMIRKNLGVELGDIVSILSFPDVKQGLIINVTTLEEQEKNPDKANLRRETLLNFVLKPYFMERARPVHVGDEIRVRRGTVKGNQESETVRFKVTDTNPSPYCFVVPQTIINLDNGLQMMTQMQAPPLNTLENQLRLAFAQQRQAEYQTARLNMGSQAGHIMSLKQQVPGHRAK